MHRFDATDDHYLSRVFHVPPSALEAFVVGELVWNKRHPFTWYRVRASDPEFPAPEGSIDLEWYADLHLARAFVCDLARPSALLQCEARIAWGGDARWCAVTRLIPWNSGQAPFRVEVSGRRGTHVVVWPQIREIRER